jgi:hypothetical protein
MRAAQLAVSVLGDVVAERGAGLAIRGGRLLSSRQILGRDVEDHADQKADQRPWIRSVGTLSKAGTDERDKGRDAESQGRASSVTRKRRPPNGDDHGHSDQRSDDGNQFHRSHRMGHPHIASK